MQIWRYLFAGTAVLFTGAVIVQVFLAGLGLFGAGDMEAHIGFGYLVAMLPVLPLLLAWPARVGRSTAGLAAATLVLAQVQTFLPLLRDDAPLVAALHPVNALAVFGLGLIVARRGMALARATQPARPTSVEPASPQP